ncbi:MAG: hypothetical protein DRP56_11125 [Planctomycetota bacterium]|nr:MAG: hypothetical protein DRP56_11125 [Planctomycetota bacterium]
MENATEDFGKVVIYTVICGKYDILKKPKVINSRFEYICFTDQKIKEGGVWEIKPLATNMINPILTNRFHKMHPHILFPKYSYSVYIDGNIQISGSHLYNRVTELIKSKAVLSMVTHPSRECVYEEARICSHHRKDKAFRIWKYFLFLKKNRYPQNKGLIEASVIFRKHHQGTVIQLMEQWWRLLNKYSHRDQLSLPYVLWNNKISYIPFFKRKGDNVRKNSGYAHFPHTVRKKHRSKILKLVSLVVPVSSWRKRIRRFNINSALTEVLFKKWFLDKKT